MNVTIEDIKAVIEQHQSAPGIRLDDTEKIDAARSLMARAAQNSADDAADEHDKQVTAELNAINNSYPTVTGSGVPAPNVEGTAKWRDDGIKHHDNELASDVKDWEATRGKIMAGVKIAASVALASSTGPAGYLAALKTVGDLLQEASA